MIPGFGINIVKSIAKRHLRGTSKKIIPDIMEFRDEKTGEFVIKYTKDPGKYSNFIDNSGRDMFIKRGKTKNVELESKVLEHFMKVKSIKTIQLFGVKDNSFGYELRLANSSYKNLESLIVPFLGKSLPRNIKVYLKDYAVQIAKVHAHGPLSFLNIDNNLISEEDYYNRLSNLITKKYGEDIKRFDKILTCYKTIANVIGNSKIKTFIKDARLKNALSSVFKKTEEKNSLFYAPLDNRLEEDVFFYISILNEKEHKINLEDNILRNTLRFYLSILDNKKFKTIYSSLPIGKIFKKSIPLDSSILDRVLERHKYRGILINHKQLETAISFCLQILKVYGQHPFNKKYMIIDGRYILEKCDVSLIDFDPEHLRLAPPQHDLSKMLLFSVKDRKKFLDTYIETYNSDVKVYNHQYSEYGIKPEVKDKKEFEFVFLNSIIDYALFCIIEKKYEPSSKFYKSQIENAIYAVDGLKNNWQTRYTKEDFKNLDYIKTFLSKGI